MRRADVFLQGELAGSLEQEGDRWRFSYCDGYTGAPISLTMPVRTVPYEFESFPPFFDGLLPEGVLLDGLLHARRLDPGDHLGQLVAVGEDLVGAVTIRDAE